MDEGQDRGRGDLDATLDRDTDLDELRDGGPPQGPATVTLAPAGAAGRATTGRGRKPRPGAAPTTTGDATTGGMATPAGTSTSDASTTGPIRRSPAPEAGDAARPARGGSGRS